jgi:hypothetical protein
VRDPHFGLLISVQVLGTGDLGGALGRVSPGWGRPADGGVPEIASSTMRGILFSIFRVGCLLVGRPEVCASVQRALDNSAEGNGNERVFTVGGKGRRLA